LEPIGRGVLGPPVKPEDDSEEKTCDLIPAARSARALLLLALEIRGRRECRMHSRTRSLACERKLQKARKQHTGEPKQTAFPAQWFTAYSALSPVSGL